MLQLTNETPLVASLMLLPDARGVDTLYTVVKGTFTIGAPVALASEQVPITPIDRHFEDPATSSIQIPSDVCLGKPAADIVVIGSAWAPDGDPTWQMDVSVKVGSATKRVRVFADRVWNTSGGGAAAAWVAPFTRMPLVWERAFGGVDTTERGPAVDARNPVGVGFRVRGGAKALAGMPLPNVEDVNALITSPDDAPEPAGFAPIAPHWEPRRQFAGTYDEKWQTDLAPYLPADFDSRFFQLAPADLRVPNLRGGEPVELSGLTPKGDVRFALPAFEIQVGYRFETSRQEQAAVLDTVLIEPDAHRVVMVWRATLGCDKVGLKVKDVCVRARSAP